MPFKYNPFTHKMDIVESAEDIGAITTITGNTGGPESPTAGNFNVVTANSTVKFAGTAATETLDFGLDNLFLGNSGSAITTGTDNTCYGRGAGNSLTGGQINTLIGRLAGAAITGSFSNTAVGHSALASFTNGAANAGSNVAIGSNSLASLATGILNISIGPVAGSNYTTSESSNIVIGANGTAAESNTIRIGTQGSAAGQQNRAFLSGVTGVTVASSAPIAVNSSGQLSSLGTGSSGQVLTSTGTTSPTWQTPGSPASTSNALVSLNTTIPNETGDNTFYGPILFDTEAFDVGSNYNPATGFFTAPTTGKYLVCTSVTFSGIGAGHTIGELRVLIDGATYTRSSFNPAAVAVSGLYTFSFSLVIPLAATQTAGIGITVAGSTKTVGVQGNDFGNYSFFSCTLMGS